MKVILAGIIFDYIIIDEFHHAVSKNYRNIIEYFTPKFLLGLTATQKDLIQKMYLPFVTIILFTK